MTSTDSRTPHHYTDAEMHNEDVAHEHSDVDVRTLLAFAAGLAVVVTTAALLMWIMFRTLESQAAARDPVASPIHPPAGEQPRAPRLLTNEPANLERVREEENRKLEGYSWIDERAGVAHVPIEEAKKLFVQHGAAVRATGTVDDPRTGTHAPAYGEASSGRAIAIPKSSATSPAAPTAPAGEVKK
jgi:hypothetical protein